MSVHKVRNHQYCAGDCVHHSQIHLLNVATPGADVNKKEKQTKKKKALQDEFNILCLFVCDSSSKCICRALEVSGISSKTASGHEGLKTQCNCGEERGSEKAA